MTTRGRFTDANGNLVETGDGGKRARPKPARLPRPARAAKPVGPPMPADAPQTGIVQGFYVAPRSDMVPKGWSPTPGHHTPTASDWEAAKLRATPLPVDKSAMISDSVAAAGSQPKVAAVAEIDPAFKERRNKAIEYHNNSMQVVARVAGASGDEAVRVRMLAYRLLCSAATVDPSLAQGWYALGNATADLKMIPASVAAFRRALELPLGELQGDMNPDLFVKALINLSHRLLNDGKVDEALVVNKRVLAYLHDHPDLDPEGAAFAWTNMSLILSIMGRDADAIRYARAGYEKSDDPIIQMGLAFALMFGGEYASGLKHFEARFAYKPELRSYREYPYSLWNGESNHGKTLFVPAEMGLGDTLSFARFLGRAAAKVGKVILAVQSELVRLFRASLRHWGNIEVTPLTTGFPLADFWRPIGSLPVALGLTTEEIRDAPQNWTAQGDDPVPPDWLSPGRKLHIGIAWAGSPLNDIDQHRSIPFPLFLDLYRVPGIQLYSLQVGEHVADLHNAGAAALVRDLSAYIRDATDTVALMRNLDLIITTESFIGHLAGAIGKECWVLYSHLGGDWRIGRAGMGALWYPAHRIFKQGPDATWQPVFDRIVEALRERLATI